MIITPRSSICDQLHVKSQLFDIINETSTDTN